MSLERHRIKYMNKLLVILDDMIRSKDIGSYGVFNCLFSLIFYAEDFYELSKEERRIISEWFINQRIGDGST